MFFLSIFSWFEYFVSVICTFFFKFWKIRICSVSNGICKVRLSKFLNSLHFLETCVIIDCQQHPNLSQRHSWHCLHHCQCFQMMSLRQMMMIFFSQSLKLSANSRREHSFKNATKILQTIRHFSGCLKEPLISSLQLLVNYSVITKMKHISILT